MDKRLLRKYQRQRFGQLLSQYRELHGCTLEQLCALLKRPKSTVCHWLRGTRIPSKAELKSICASININSEQVFSEQATREMFFETQVIGFEALQARFLDVRRTLMLEALEYVPITGAVLNNRLVRAGLCTCLTVRDDFQTRIALHDAGLNGLFVVVRANGVPGLGFEIYRADAEVYAPWVALSDLHVERLVEHLLHKLS